MLSTRWSKINNLMMIGHPFLVFSGLLGLITYRWLHFLIFQPWKLLSAHEAAWSSGFCGEGVRVGIFDTGLVNTNIHRHFRHATVKERTNWTWRTKDSREVGIGTGFRLSLSFPSRHVGMLSNSIDVLPSPPFWMSKRSLYFSDFSPIFENASQSM